MKMFTAVPAFTALIAVLAGCGSSKVTTPDRGAGAAGAVRAGGGADPAAESDRTLRR